MVRLANAHETVQPPVRHGTCRLQITIGGTSYSLRPIPAQPRGVTVWVLRSLDGPRAGTRYSVASVNRQAGCTCPDHETNGATCKHVMALRAIGLIPRSARTVREASAEASARAARRPAKALADLAGRIHSAPPVAEAVAATVAERPAAPAGRDPLARARRFTARPWRERHAPDRRRPRRPLGLQGISPMASGPRSAPTSHPCRPPPASPRPPWHRSGVPNDGDSPRYRHPLPSQSRLANRAVVPSNAATTCTPAPRRPSRVELGRKPISTPTSATRPLPGLQRAQRDGERRDPDLVPTGRFRPHKCVRAAHPRTVGKLALGHHGRAEDGR